MGTSVWDLIDTLWNVKEITAVGKLLAKHDLIDTLWNVKEDIKPHEGYYIEI